MDLDVLQLQTKQGTSETCEGGELTLGAMRQ